MKYRRHTLQLLAVAAASSSIARATEQILEEQKKEHAVGTVERILSWFHSKNDNKKKHEESSIRVQWDGRFLTPLVLQEDQGSDDIKDHHVPPPPVKKMQFPLQELISKELGDEVGVLSKQDHHSGTRHANKKRQRRRRKTTKDGSTKEAKSCNKGSKSSKGVQVIRKSPKRTKSGGEEDILCFRGTAEEVTAACDMYNAGCCSGEDACMWEGESTICQGACSGRSACFNIPQGSYIGQNSCSGGFGPCFGLNYMSTECEALKIGQNSCRGTQACIAMCASSTICKVKIGDYSCNSDSRPACSSMSRFSDQVESIQIGSYACTDGFGSQCYGVGRESPANIKIGDHACTDALACGFLGRQAVHAKVIQVGQGSCEGPEACVGFGYEMQGDAIVIGQDACYNFRSCVLFGSRAPGNLMVGNSACGYVYSCDEVGFYSTGDIAIQDEACSALESCQKLGFRAQGSIEVGKGACGPEYACQALAYRAASDVSIGKNACDMYAFQCSGRRDFDCLDTSFIPKDGTYCPAP